MCYILISGITSGFFIPMEFTGSHILASAFSERVTLWWSVHTHKTWLYQTDKLLFVKYVKVFSKSDLWESNRDLFTFTILHLDGTYWHNIRRKNFTDVFFRYKNWSCSFLDLGRLTRDLYQLLSYYYVHMINIIYNIILRRHFTTACCVIVANKDHL